MLRLGFLGGWIALAMLMPGESPPRDPAAWGSDHVGKPVPEYVTGEECLFCHRSDVGPSWGKNFHHLTIHEAEAGSSPLADLRKNPALVGVAGEVKLLLGAGRQRCRFLKPQEAYGKVDLLSVQWAPPHPGKPAQLLDADMPHWDTKSFADRCAGCHATAVDPRTEAFSALGLDCYTCHGLVDVKHSKDPKLVLFAKKRQDPARVVISTCAQCHVRTGKSKSTGRPYPDNFVPGDNLFRDFQVDFSDEALKKLNPGDRHVLENVRDVVRLGKEDVTCLSCHDVHKQSSKKHHRVAERDTCTTCHPANGSKKVRIDYDVHSPTCGY